MSHHSNLLFVSLSLFCYLHNPYITATLHFIIHTAANLFFFLILFLICTCALVCFFFFSSRRRHTRLQGDWSSDVCSSDLIAPIFSGRCSCTGRARSCDSAVEIALEVDRTLVEDDAHDVVRRASERSVVSQIGRASCRERV